jgi:hypothetical protein
MASEINASVAMLRHTLATVAYRGGKAVRGASEAYPNFKLTPMTRTPIEILAHIGDLFDWALSLAQGRNEWHNSSPLSWEEEIDRFFRTLAAFDGYLVSGLPLGATVEKLFQGPVADALTHIGQLTMLRRVAGTPMRSENYFKADIVIGRVGPDQTAPRMEFD